MNTEQFRNIDTQGLVAWLEERDTGLLASLYSAAFKMKKDTVGEAVYLRGLVEISNRCRKNCLYCGIRRDNPMTARYDISDEEVLSSAQFAADEGYGSMVIQGGERTDSVWIGRITSLLERIKKIRPAAGSKGDMLGSPALGITLSLGEQKKDVYRQWFSAGAHRYLLRIEASDRELFEKIHPSDTAHAYDVRLQALYDLKEAGYQVGTGVMIGLPFQTSENLAHDLEFFRSFDIDMCGMGPYIEHSDTPLYNYRHLLMPKSDRLELSIKMVALLRLMMPDINIAATTAMQALDPMGREKAIMAGANVLMPNLTLSEVRQQYQIYQGKPGIKEDAAVTNSSIETRLSEKNIPIGYAHWGDSLHFGK